MAAAQVLSPPSHHTPWPATMDSFVGHLARHEPPNSMFNASTSTWRGGRLTYPLDGSTEPISIAWDAGGLAARVVDQLDELDVKFTMIGVFGLGLLDTPLDKLAAAIVVTVLPGSLTVENAKEAVGHLGVILSGYVCCCPFRLSTARSVVLTRVSASTFSIPSALRCRKVVWPTCAAAIEVSHLTTSTTHSSVSAIVSVPPNRTPLDHSASACDFRRTPGDRCKPCTSA